MPGVRGVPVAALMGGVLLLAGCQDEHRAASGSAPSATDSSASSPAASPAATPTAAPSASVTSSASPSVRPPSASASEPDRAATRIPSSLPPAVPAGCRNLAAGSAVKAAVTSAYRRAFPRFIHIVPVPGEFFYGQCGAVRYAATPFRPTADAGYDELVAMQDEGSTRKYFRTAADGTWVYVTGDGFPPGPHGCAGIPQIPRALSAAWRDCSTAH
ncbi:hypothetical protein ACFXC9_12640 [Streptomyces naganishii]|uniref:hypothetical protein n=1 Tax=Streptomyces naganishii TaxID=285447 RepID=UPI0036B23EC3